MEIWQIVLFCIAVQAGFIIYRAIILRRSAGELEEDRYIRNVSRLEHEFGGLLVPCSWEECERCYPQKKPMTPSRLELLEREQAAQRKKEKSAYEQAKINDFIQVTGRSVPWMSGLRHDTTLKWWRNPYTRAMEFQISRGKHSIKQVISENVLMSMSDYEVNKAVQSWEDALLGMEMQELVNMEIIKPPKPFPPLPSGGGGTTHLTPSGGGGTLIPPTPPPSIPCDTIKK